MPSLRTRLMYQALTLNAAQSALQDASEAVAQATEQLNDLSTGTLDLDAVTIGGVRFVNEDGTLVSTI